MAKTPSLSLFRVFVWRGSASEVSRARWYLYERRIGTRSQRKGALASAVSTAQPRFPLCSQESGKEKHPVGWGGWFWGAPALLGWPRLGSRSTGWMPTPARPRGRGLPRRRGELGCGQSGSCPSRNPRDFAFLTFLGSCEVFACFPRDLGAHPLPEAGATPGTGYFFFPFLGKDARAEKQWAAEPGPDERASPTFPLPAQGAPAGDGNAAAPRGMLPPGKRGQEVLAPISSTGWRRMEKQHQRGAAPMGDEHHPAPSIAAPGPDPAPTPRHGPRRTFRGCASRRIPTLPTTEAGCGVTLSLTHPLTLFSPPSSPQLFPQVPLNANHSRPHHVRRGDHRPGLRQRLRPLQSRLCRRRCPPRRLPLHRGAAPAPGGYPAGDKQQPPATPHPAIITEMRLTRPSLSPRLGRHGRHGAERQLRG